jgi:exoribonuclease-2
MSGPLDDMLGRALFYRAGKTALAGVVVEAGKKALQVLTPQGTTERVEPSEVLLLSQATGGQKQKLDHVAEVLRVLGGLDMRTTWELVLEEGEESLTLDDVATIACPGSLPLANLEAVALSMGLPGTFFKRRGNAWTPLPRKQVLAREEEERRVREAEETTAAAAQEIWEVAQRTRPLESLSPSARSVFLALRDSALQGRPTTLASAVLAKLCPGDSRPFEALSFALMVRLGVWQEHEDLNLLRLGFQAEFAPEVAAEALQCAARVLPAAAGRPVLDQFISLAIDDAETVEVDDALALEPTETGCVLHVMICDVASTVQRGGLLDREAGRRACTVYHPALRLPMLPPILSEDALSLAAGKARLVLDHALHVNRESEVYDVRIQPAVLPLTRRLTYEEADGIIASGAGPEGEILGRMFDVAEKMRLARTARGAVQFHPVEPKVRVVDGKVKVALCDTFSPSRRMVAELMIAAGTSAAAILAAKKVSAIFRFQPPPDEELNWTEEKSRDPLYIHDVVRKMKKASISLLPQRHAALGVEAYCQVTSPLRRYGDLLMQRQLHSALQAGVACYGEGELLALMSVAEETSLQVRKLSDAAHRYWLLVALRERIGTTVQGLVLALERRQVVVRLVEFGTEGRYFPAQTVRPGDRVALRVVHVDPRTDTLVLREAERGGEHG